MSETTCKCGCGETLPPANKNGFKWGHKGKPATAAATPPPEAAPDPQPEQKTDPTRVVLTLDAAQIELIWQMFPISEKALAISEGLFAIRD